MSSEAQTVVNNVNRLNERKAPYMRVETNDLF